MRISISAALSSIVITLVALAPSTAHAASCDGFAPYGLPRAKLAEENTVTICEKSNDGSKAFFVTDYDRAEVAPRWVSYKLTRDEMLAGTTSGITRKKDAVPFASDSAIETGDFKSPSNDDYNGIKAKGYDRGHYLPADAMSWDLDAYHSTYTVANIALQADKFNEGLWQKVENQERGWACDHKTIYSVTGVIFAGANATSFSSNKHADLIIFVPTHYWKVVYTPESGGKAVGIIFPNVNNVGPLDAKALKSVSEIEKLTGLDFMPKLAAADRRRIEVTKPDTAFWKITYPMQFTCK